MKVIIAGADPKIRFAISVLVHEQPGWTVVDVCARATELVDALRTYQPDLLILDQDLPTEDLPADWENLLGSDGFVIFLVSTPIHGNHPIDLAHDRRIPVSKLESPETLIDLFHRIQTCG
jgi:chemotaxis response regulator CheB